MLFLIYSCQNSATSSKLAYSFISRDFNTIIHIIKGLSTAKGGRGHVTTYIYCVTIKIQTLGQDILKIARKIRSYTISRTIYKNNAEGRGLYLY